MALTPNLVRQAIVSPGTSSIWDDDTVYGGSNPARNTVALYLAPYKVDQNQVYTLLTINSYTPATVTQFTTTNTIDGWYRYYFLIVSNWSNSTTYNQLDVVYNTGDMLNYQYINTSPSSGHAVSDTTYWAPITIDPKALVSTIGMIPGNIIYQVIDKVVDFQTSICYLKAASKHAKHSCNIDDCGCSSRSGKYLHKIRDLFAVLPINEATGQFIEGERNARLVEKYCSDCGCIER